MVCFSFFTCLFTIFIVTRIKGSSICENDLVWNLKWSISYVLYFVFWKAINKTLEKIRAKKLKFSEELGKTYCLFSLNYFPVIGRTVTNDLLFVSQLKSNIRNQYGSYFDYSPSVSPVATLLPRPCVIKCRPP